jgi:tRNA 2-thiouridine synthesizing protein A
MANKEVIDARGLSCPQPVLLTKKALEKGGSAYEVLVDNGTAKENVTRFAQNAGYKVSAAEDGDDYRLTLTK